jgi:preprotein translocase subunit SecA
MREYDRVLADQRRLIYAERAPAARGEDLGDQARSLIGEVVRAHVAAASGEGLQAARFWRGLRDLYPLTSQPPWAVPGGGEIPRALLPRIAEHAAADAQRIYNSRELELGTAVIREMERRVILASLDRGWREHLQAMPDLLNAIATRTAGAAALAEYRREGTLAFNRMHEAVNREIVRWLFYIRIDQSDPGLPG